MQEANIQDKKGHLQLMEPHCQEPDLNPGLPSSKIWTVCISTLLCAKPCHDQSRQRLSELKILRKNFNPNFRRRSTNLFLFFVCMESTSSFIVKMIFHPNIFLPHYNAAYFNRKISLQTPNMIARGFAMLDTIGSFCWITYFKELWA